MSRKKSRDKTSLILIGIIVLTILSYVGIYGSKYLPHGDRPEGLSDNPNAMFIDHDALSVEIENIDGGAIRPDSILEVTITNETLWRIIIEGPDGIVGGEANIDMLNNRDELLGEEEIILEARGDNNSSITLTYHPTPVIRKEPTTMIIMINGYYLNNDGQKGDGAGGSVVYTLLPLEE